NKGHATRIKLVETDRRAIERCKIVWRCTSQAKERRINNQTAVVERCGREVRAARNIVVDPNAEVRGGIRGAIVEVDFNVVLTRRQRERADISSACCGGIRNIVAHKMTTSAVADDAECDASTTCGS